MQNEVIDPNKPVFDGTPTWKPRRFDPHNESRSFFDDAAIARMEEIEAIEDDGERSFQINLFILRQASFLPITNSHQFEANVEMLIRLVGFIQSEEE